MRLADSSKQTRAPLAKGIDPHISLDSNLSTEKPPLKTGLPARKVDKIYGSKYQ